MAGPTLSTAPPEHPILDYAALRRDGIAELERLTDGQWTDFNRHDPGITILEAICYGLTDLGYRIFHPVPDLLADGGADASRDLYTPAQILTGAAVTITDLRKVVLDVAGVRNVWIEPVTEPAPPLWREPGPDKLNTLTAAAIAPAHAEAVPLAGLYRVSIERSGLEDRNPGPLLREVAERLHAHRALCQDFEQIRVLPALPVTVTASVEIAATANSEAVLLAIYRRIDAYISPSFAFKTLTQLMAAGSAADAPFDGPALERGFLDSTAVERAQRRKTLNTSDILRELMAIPEVRVVRSVAIARRGTSPGEAWSLAVDDPNSTPVFDYTASVISLCKGPRTVTVDKAAVDKAFARDFAQARRYEKLPDAERDFSLPAGVDRKVASYFPLAEEFPRAYGVGRGTLPASATNARKAQANQLRGYLALFDQVLANDLAQLAHARDLLSFTDDGSTSLFSQVVETDPDRPPLYTAAFSAERLQALNEPAGPADGLRRRHDFLNHLLARFGEELGEKPDKTPDTAPQAWSDELLAVKRDFLRQLPKLSGGRGTGVNCLNPEAKYLETPLAQRIRLKLGLSDVNANRFYVVEHILLRPIAADAGQELPFLTDAASKDPFSLQLSIVAPDHLKCIAAMVERVVRDETPAHIVPYLVFLDSNAMMSFVRFYQEWLDSLRTYWLADKLGLPPEPTP
jgi:hypothetical protein